MVLREPGGVEVSERIRALLADPALTIDPRAEALLYAAARAQLVAEELRPLLEAGETVLLDRFVDSSLAYQGAGRGLGVEEVRALNEFGTGGLRPDRTLLLRIDPAVGLARIRTGRPTAWSRRTASSSARSRAPTTSWRPPSRSGSWCIDAGRPPEAVLADALAALQPRSRPGWPDARPRRRRSSSRGPSPAPSRARADPVAGGHQLGRVAGAARLLARGDLPAGHAAGGLDDLATE